MVGKGGENRGCLWALLSIFLGGGKNRTALPYGLRDDFLSPAEKSFYKILKVAVGLEYTICPKVGLSDLFFVQQPNRNAAFRNKIDRKHVDFVLCDSGTMRPSLAVELDDGSHARADRQQRDRFVDEVFRTAGLRLVHIPARHSYAVQEIRSALSTAIPSPRGQQESLQDETPQAPRPEVVPLCPKCGVPMVHRTATRSGRQGDPFYGCPNYPRCREILPGK